MTIENEAKIAADQLRECHNRCAAAMVSLATANEIMQSRQDQMPMLLEKVTAAKAEITAAHQALLNFSGMLLPTQGRA